MRSLEAVLFEIGEMQRTTDSAPIDESSRRALNVILARLQADAQSMMDWLSEARLEEERN
jgi:hypothetical protein